MLGGGTAEAWEVAVGIDGGVLHNVGWAEFATKSRRKFPLGKDEEMPPEEFEQAPEGFVIAPSRRSERAPDGVSGRLGFGVLHRSASEWQPQETS